MPSRTVVGGVHSPDPSLKPKFSILYLKALPLSLETEATSFLPRRYFSSTISCSSLSLSFRTLHSHQLLLGRLAHGTVVTFTSLHSHTHQQRPPKVPVGNSSPLTCALEKILSLQLPGVHLMEIL